MSSLEAYRTDATSFSRISPTPSRSIENSRVRLSCLSESYCSPTFRMYSSSPLEIYPAGISKFSATRILLIISAVTSPLMSADS